MCRRFAAIGQDDRSCGRRHRLRSSHFIAVSLEIRSMRRSKGATIHQGCSRIATPSGAQAKTKFQRLPAGSVWLQFFVAARLPVPCVTGGISSEFVLPSHPIFTCAGPPTDFSRAAASSNVQYAGRPARAACRDKPDVGQGHPRKRGNDALYTPLLAAAPKDGVRIEAAIARKCSLQALRQKRRPQ